MAIKSTEHTIVNMGTLSNVREAAMEHNASELRKGSPDLEHLNYNVAALMLEDLKEHPPNSQELEGYYAGLIDTFGQAVMSYQIKKNKGDPNYEAYMSLSEHDRVPKLERYRQAVMESMLYPVSRYTETLGATDDPNAEKRRLVIMMYLQARVGGNNGQVNLAEIRNLGHHGNGQRELDIMTEEELTEAVRAIERVTAPTVLKFEEFNKMTRDFSDSELERRRIALNELNAIIDRYTPPELEQNSNYANIFPEKAQAGRYANHDKNVRRAQREKLITGPVDATPRKDITERSIFGQETHPKPRSYIEVKGGKFIINPETGERFPVETMEWTINAPVRRIELDVGYDESMLLQAQTAKKLEVVSRAVASGKCDSPQTLVAMQERFESAQLSRDGKSIRFAISPPPNWLHVTQEEFRQLYANFERVKASYERAGVKLEKYREQTTPEMAMLAENKLDKNELSAEAGRIAGVYVKQIEEAQTAGDLELAEQLKEAKTSTLRRINEVINIAGIESEYVAMAENRLRSRGVIDDEYKTLHPKVYSDLVAKEAEAVKLEMLYKALAVKLAANKVRALQKDNPDELIDYTLNMDYGMEEWTARKMAQETQQGDSLDEELAKLTTVFESIRRTPGGIEVGQLKLETRRIELRAKFIAAAQAWTKLFDHADAYRKAELVRLKAELIGDVTPHLFKADIDDVLEGKDAEYTQLFAQAITAMDNLNARLKELETRDPTVIADNQRQNISDVRELITIMRVEQIPTPAEMARLNAHEVSQNIRTTERDITDFETELTISTKYGIPNATNAETVMDDLRGYADKYAPRRPLTTPTPPTSATPSSPQTPPSQQP